MLALGYLPRVGASVLYNTSIALQALEARDVPHEHSLRISLIGKLVRNPKWLGATALGLLGWPLEIVALLLAPLTVVQPCLVSGLIVLLWLGATKLGEAPGRREFVAVGGDRGRGRRVSPGRRRIAPPITPAPWRSSIALGLVAIPIAAPYLLRRRAASAQPAGRAQRRLRLRLDGDRQQAADRRAGGGDAAGRGRSGWPPRWPRRAWRC